MIIEGKGGSISVQGRRGDIERLKRDVSNTIGDAWNQCARVRRYLASTTAPTFTDARGREVLRLPKYDASGVFYVNPMLHSLGSFEYELPRLKDLGILGDQHTPWPVLVTDLRVIAEMVSSPAELLHYMRWRSSLAIGDTITAVDELDIFGAYLFGRVGRTDVPNDGTLYFGDSTTDFNTYYAGELGRGPAVPKPRKMLGTMFESALRSLAQRRPRGWLESSYAILDLPLTEAAALEGYAYSADIDRDEWTFEIAGQSAIVILGESLEPTAVLLEIARVVPAASRQFIVRQAQGGASVIAAQRRRSPA